MRRSNGIEDCTVSSGQTEGYKRTCFQVSDIKDSGFRALKKTSEVFKTSEVCKDVGIEPGKRQKDRREGST